MLKKWLHPNVIMCIVLFAVASCKNTSDKTDNNYAFKLPVIKPLVFTTPQKIHWVNTAYTAPVVKSFDLDKLPDSVGTGSDTTDLQPFKHPVEESKFDFNALPSKNLDIDKLPSHPVKFLSEILPPPVVIHAGPPHASTVSAALYELSEYQGLSGKVVTGVLKDHNGFIWIATENGLYRYDGETLIHYFQTTGLYVDEMKEDKSGRIWMAADYSGILTFDPKTNVGQMLAPGKGLPGKTAYSIFIDDKQKIWVAVDGKISIIDAKASTIKTLTEAQGLPGYTFMLTADRDKNIWVSTIGRGIEIINPKNKTVKYINIAQGLKTDTAITLKLDHKGRMWVAESTKANHLAINVFDPYNGNVKYIDELPPSNTCSRFFEDNTGTMWLGIATGTARVNLDKQLAGNLQLSAIKALDANMVYNFCDDNEGNVWIAGRQGLFMKKQNHNLVKHIGNSQVSSLYEDKRGLIWVADNDGVHVFNRKNNTYKNIRIRQGLTGNNVETITAAGGKIAICTTEGLNIIDTAAKTIQTIPAWGKLINAFFADKAGNMLIGSDKGIEIYNPINKTQKHIGIEQGLSDSLVDDINLDKQNNIWIAHTHNATDIINPETNTLKHLKNQASGDEMFLKNTTDSVWIGTPTGIYIADEKNKTLTSISDAQGLLGQSVISLLQYDNKIYAATKKGINVINLPLPIGADKPLGITSYWVTKTVGSFLTDLITKDGLYWRGDAGIDVFNLSNKLKTAPPICYITGFNLMDHPTVFEDVHDLDATANDVITRFKDSVVYQDEKKLVAENPLLIYNKGGEVSGPYNLPSNLVLPHDKNYLQFHYTSLNLVRTDSTQYRYMLDGVDQQWSARTSATSSGNYFNLSPGIYTFKVESLGNDSMWGAPATFSFIIASPWWQTWSARFIFMLLIIGAVWAFVQYRSLQLIKANRLLEHKIHVRTEEVLQQKEEIEAQRDHLEAAVKELKVTQTQLIQSEKLASLGELTAGIAHEIQNPLNFINNFSEVNTELIDEMNEEIEKGNLDEVKEIAANIKENQQKINHHGKRADGIVKNMLQHSRNNSGEKQLTDINTLADEYFRLSYHGLRAKDKSFNAEMATNFDENLPRLNIISQDIGRVLLNLFNNAFYAVQQRKKAEGGDYRPLVTVSTALNGDMVEIKVGDNGTGIPDAVKDKILQPFFTTKPTGEGTGLGLSLSHDIVYKGHNGSIAIETKEGEYTIFTVSLPA